MGCIEDFPDAGNEFRILGRKVVDLSTVAFQVVDFDGGILPLPVDLVLNGLPLADPGGSLAPAFEELPVEIFVLFLFLTQESGKETDAIKILRCFRACQFAEGRKEVPMG